MAFLGQIVRNACHCWSMTPATTREGVGEESAPLLAVSLVEPMPVAARSTWGCCADRTAAFIQNFSIALVILGTLWSAVMILGTAEQLGWGLAIILTLCTTLPNIPFNAVAVTRFQRLQSGRQIGVFLLTATLSFLSTVYMEAGAEQATSSALPIDAWAEEYMGSRLLIQILNMLVQFATAFPTMTTLLNWEHTRDGRSFREHYFGSHRTAIILNSIGHLINLGGAACVTWDLFTNMTNYANNPDRQSLYNFLFDAMQMGVGAIMLRLLCSIPEGLFFIRGNHLTQEMIPSLYADLSRNRACASIVLAFISTIWAVFSGGTYVGLGVQSYKANPEGSTRSLSIAFGAAIAAAEINYEACIRVVNALKHPHSAWRYITDPASVTSYNMRLTYQTLDRASAAPRATLCASCFGGVAIAAEDKTVEITPAA